MIYLIGGTPRVGKTTLSKMIMERKGIPFIPLDALTHALDHTYPDLGIRKEGWDSIPDKFFPYLKQLVISMGWTLPDSVIEGDSFLPKHAKELASEHNVRSIFLGTSKVTLEDITGKVMHDDWVNNLPEDEKQKLPDRLIEMSEKFRKGCEEEDLTYLDMSPGREEMLEKAYRALFA